MDEDGSRTVEVTTKKQEDQGHFFTGGNVDVKETQIRKKSQHTVIKEI